MAKRPPVPQFDINFTVSPADRDVIARVARRFIKLAGLPSKECLGVQMDLVATHNHGCRLDLTKLQAADDFNLTHDVGGIRRHLDRETGELRNCFWPRCAAKDAAEA